MADKKDKEAYELNKKAKELYENHAKELTDKCLKDHPNLKFIPVYGTDESGRPIITMKLVKKEKNSNEKDTK